MHVPPARRHDDQRPIRRSRPRRRYIMLAGTHRERPTHLARRRGRPQCWCAAYRASGRPTNRDPRALSLARRRDRLRHSELSALIHAAVPAGRVAPDRFNTAIPHANTRRLRAARPPARSASGPRELGPAISGFAVPAQADLTALAVRFRENRAGPFQTRIELDEQRRWLPHIYLTGPGATTQTPDRGSRRALQKARRWRAEREGGSLPRCFVAGWNERSDAGSFGTLRQLRCNCCCRYDHEQPAGLC